MGLDIWAYEKVNRLGSIPDSQDDIDFYDEAGTLCIKAYHDEFLPHLGGMEEGVYRYSGKEYCDRFGSYSGYSAWRDYVSVCYLGYTADQAFEQLSINDPMYFLICFSDCEGFIGGTAISKLIQDIEGNTEALKEVQKFDADWQGTGQNWATWCNWTRIDKFLQMLKLTEAKGVIQFS